MMDKRRILIGSMIGILSFTLISWISSNTWEALETQLLQGRSAIRLYNPFSKTNYNIIQYSKNDLFNLENKTLDEQRQSLMNLVTELAAQNASSITIVIDKFNSLDINNLDLEAAIGDFNSVSKTIKIEDIDTVIKQEQGPSLWLDRKQHKLKEYSSSDLNSGNISPKAIQGKNFIIVSPKTELSSDKLNLLINFLSDRWVNYFQINPLIMCLSLVVLGIFLASIIYWARIVAFFIIGTATLIMGQIIFALFNTNIETIPLLAGFTCALITSNLFDLNLLSVDKNNFFQAIQNPSPKAINEVSTSSNPTLQNRSTTTINSDSLNDLRAKFFHEQESILEDIALAFQEKTIKSVNTVESKIEELNESTQLSERDRNKVALLKHNFEHLIEEIDSILFNLVPFRFENDKGLISILELYASKTFLLSKGKIQISIDTEFPVLKLELDQKINAYRIIQRLIELVKEANIETLSSGMIIAINLHSNKNGKLRIRISYEGIPVDSNANNFKINEVYKRVAGMSEASINFGNSAIANIAKNLTNHIELEFKSFALGAIKINRKQTVGIN